MNRLAARTDQFDRHISLCRGSCAQRHVEFADRGDEHRDDRESVSQAHHQPGAESIPSRKPSDRIEREERELKGAGGQRRRRIAVRERSPQPHAPAQNEDQKTGHLLEERRPGFDDQHHADEHAQEQKEHRPQAVGDRRTRIVETQSRVQPQHGGENHQQQKPERDVDEILPAEQSPASPARPGRPAASRIASRMLYSTPPILP